MVEPVDRRDAAPDFFGSDAEVAALRGSSASADRLKLAWMLRQRDARAALALVQALPADLAPGERGRAALVCAEAAWLMNRFDDSAREIDAAHASFAKAGDEVGRGDAALMRATLDNSTGGDRDGALQRALLHYARAGDAKRRCLAALWLACAHAVVDAQGQIDAPLQAVLREAAAFGDPGLETFRLSFEGSLAWNAGDSAAALGLWQRTFDAAMACGQIVSALTTAENCAVALSTLSDHEGALEWAQRARGLAEPTGWPYRAAWCQAQVASVLVGAGRAAEAKALLLEALPQLLEHGGTRNTMLARMTLAEACVELGDDEEALRACDHNLAEAVDDEFADVACGSLRYRALALSRLQRVGEAMAAAGEALAIAERHQMLARMATIQHVQAQIALEHHLGAPSGSPHASGAIHHLHRALATASRIESYSVPPDWWAELSQAHEAAGDLAAALAAQREAGRATERVHTRRAEAMASLMLVRHQTERALADAAHQRTRAELLQTQAELDKARAQAMLVHAGKMVAMGQLASGAAHEMSHPAGTVSLLAETLLASREALPDAAREAVQTMAAEARRLQRFVARLREFARAEPLQLTRLLLADVLADARSLFAPRLAAESIGLDESLPEAWVEADLQRLALVLANLVFNAADAMRGVPRGERRIAIGAEMSAGDVLLHVDDQGTGIAEDVLPRLFEPFFTTKPQGLGLGLALSAESLQAMQGRLRAANRTEGGARFTIILPRRDPPGAARAA